MLDHLVSVHKHLCTTELWDQLFFSALPSKIQIWCTPSQWFTAGRWGGKGADYWCWNIACLLDGFNRIKYNAWTETRSRISSSMAQLQGPYCSPGLWRLRYCCLGLCAYLTGGSPFAVRTYHCTSLGFYKLVLHSLLKICTVVLMHKPGKCNMENEIKNKGKSIV